MTNSNEALRACPFCAAILEYCNDKDGEFWMHPGLVTDGECFMSGTGIFPGQVAAWNRRPSPVAGGDLRVRALDGANSHYFDHRIVVGDGDAIERGDGGECIAFADEPWASRIAAALNQPATPVEAVDDAVVALVYAARNFLYEPGWCDGISVESDALDKALDAFSSRIPPEPAASMVAQGERWQPIGTAPKDGTAILALLTDSDLPHTIRFRDGQWLVAWDGFDLTANSDRPEYWMPLRNRPATHHKGSSDGQ